MDIKKTGTSIFFSALWLTTIMFIVCRDTWPITPSTLKHVDYMLAVILIAHLISVIGNEIAKANASNLAFVRPTTKQLILPAMVLAFLNIAGGWLALSEETGKTIIGVAAGCLLSAGSISLIVFSFMRSQNKPME